MRTVARAVAAAILLVHAAHVAAKAALVGSGLLDSLKEAAEQPMRVVSCIGMRGTGKSTLMRSMFGPEAGPETILSDDGLALLEAESGYNYVSSSKSFRIGARDAGTALAAADVAVYNVFLHDLQRSLAAALSDLQPAMEEYVSLYSAGAAGPAKKELVIAVRDFDADAAAQRTVQQVILQHLQRTWSQAVRPSSLADAALEDLFDVSFSFLPHYSLSSQDYLKEVEELRSRLVRGGKRDSATAFRSRLNAIASHMGAAYEAPQQRDMSAAYTAKAAASQCLSTYRHLVATLLSSSGDSLDPEFGAHVDSIIDEVLQQFNDAVSKAAGSSAVTKKTNELKQNMLRDMQELYYRQLSLLRSAALEKFRRNPTTLRITPTLKKDMEAAMKEADEYFVDAAKGLKSKHLPAGHDNERKELKSDMSTIAAERMQLAKLQGMDVAAKSRRPVGIGLHWLLPEPFGTDARQSVMTAADGTGYSSTKPQADPLWFEFAPLDEVPGPSEGKEVESAKIAALKNRAEKMVYRRSRG